MKKGDILQAYENCPDENTLEKTNLATIYADKQFDQKRYKSAAKYYAKSSKSFEEVSLKFLNINKHSNLIEYLQFYLEKIQN